jgi:hypothetical protein
MIDINTGAEQESRYPAARFNEKGCLQVWGGDALRMLHNVLKLAPKTLGFLLWFYCRPGSPDQGKLIPTLGPW